MVALQPPVPALLATSKLPKRKQDQLSLDDRPHTPILQNPPSKFSFELPAQDGDDGSCSPRSKIARKFQGLALGVVVADSGATTWASFSTNTDLDSASGLMKPSASQSFGGGGNMNYVSIEGQSEDGFSVRKRLKLPDAIETTPRKHEAALAGASLNHTTSIFAAIRDKTPESQANTLVEDSTPTETAKNLDTSGAKASPSKTGSGITLPHQNPAAKGRGQRAGTPPLVAAKTSVDGNTAEDPDVDVFDPVRAALTWHEDEITIYDPNDEDDDGVGINGIGFRPTPAIAHARSMKRRQQLAEYRKREEREARARRTLRRRTSPKSGSEVSKIPAGDVKHTQSPEPPARRVRFTDFEPTVVITN